MLTCGRTSTRRGRLSAAEHALRLVLALRSMALTRRWAAMSATPGVTRGRLIPSVVRGTPADFSRSQPVKMSKLRHLILAIMVVATGLSPTPRACSRLTSIRSRRRRQQSPARLLKRRLTKRVVVLRPARSAARLLKRKLQTRLLRQALQLRQSRVRSARRRLIRLRPLLVQTRLVQASQNPRLRTRLLPARPMKSAQRLAAQALIRH